MESKIGSSTNPKRRQPCKTCGGGMSGYVNAITGRLFSHGCGDCAGPIELLDTIEEEKAAQ